MLRQYLRAIADPSKHVCNAVMVDQSLAANSVEGNE
jgi:hypothetical protein